MKIVYIAGYGRSGSTILDLLLSNTDEAFGVGELTNLHKSGWINNEFCSCGNRANDCDFWSKIKMNYECNSKMSIEEYHLQKTKYEKITTGIFNLMFDYLFQTKKYSAFKVSTKILYQLIADVSNKSVLIESSKSPLRLLSLKLMGFNIKTLFLFRNGFSVLNSVRKPLKKDLENGIQQDLDPQSTLKTALSWKINNYMVLLFCIGDNMKLKYESLIKNPSKIITSIGEYCQIDVKNVLNLISSKESFKKGHAIAGNRLRMSSEIKLIDKPSSSRAYLNFYDYILFYIVNWDLMIYFNSRS
jgi:hypothetical protein